MGPGEARRGIGKVRMVMCGDGDGVVMQGDGWCVVMVVVLLL